MPVLTTYFPVLASGILGKGVLFVTPPLEDYLTVLTAKLEQVAPIYSRLPGTELTMNPNKIVDS